ncbi:hypothetical protein B6U91_02170, partial [Candidatus Pacearchaeota archaeon ex4484_71]
MVKKKSGNSHAKKSSEKSEKRPTTVISKNPWVLVTIILLALTIFLLVANYGGKSSGEKVGEAFVDFINSKGGAQIEYVNFSDFSPDLYKVFVSSNGAEIPVYITKDGKYFVQIVSEIKTTESSDKKDQGDSAKEGVVKSDRPSVQLFIWSYCPYGVTAQKPLSEVAALLGDYADFEGVLYYAGHGEHEVEQNKIQECIQKIAPESYWEYAGKFVDQIYPKCGQSRDKQCDLTESVALMNSLGIDSAAVMSCVDSEGDSLADKSYKLAQELGVRGSPTLIINGKVVNAARNAQAYKEAVCEA